MTTPNSFDDSLDWRPVIRFEDYQVSNTGLVRSSKKQLKAYTNPYGYKVVSLHKDKKQHSCRVHRLVLEAFAGKSPTAKPYCCHIDGNRLNNHIDNLRWGSAKDNYEDARRHGTNSTGEKHGRSKLDNQKVAEIRKLVSEGLPQRTVAKLYGVNQAVVCKIKKGVIWRTS